MKQLRARVAGMGPALRNAARALQLDGRVHQASRVVPPPTGCMRDWTRTCVHTVPLAGAGPNAAAAQLPASPTPLPAFRASN